MCEAQTCASFYYSSDKCTGQWCCGSTLKNELPDPRGSLANHIPSRAIPFTTCIKCIITFCIFKFCVYLLSYIRLFMKLNLFKILLYVTFITMKVSRSTVHHHSELASNEISNYCMCINFHGVQNFVASSCEIIRL